MKRKLIKTNKIKISSKFKKYGHLYIFVNRKLSKRHIDKFKHRYFQYEDYENAFREKEDDLWIWIPIVIKSKCKKSRITNNIYGYSLEFSFEEFNKKYNTNYNSVCDIPVKC